MKIKFKAGGWKTKREAVEFPLVEQPAATKTYEDGLRDGKESVFHHLECKTCPACPGCETYERLIACGALRVAEPPAEKENADVHDVRNEYQDARGAAPSLTGLSAEDAIRRIRDAE